MINSKGTHNISCTCFNHRMLEEFIRVLLTMYRQLHEAALGIALF